MYLYKRLLVFFYNSSNVCFLMLLTPDLLIVYVALYLCLCGVAAHDPHRQVQLIPSYKVAD